MKNLFKKLPFFLFLLAMTVAFMATGKKVNAYVSKSSTGNGGTSSPYSLTFSGTYSSSASNGTSNTVSLSSPGIGYVCFYFKAPVTGTVTISSSYGTSHGFKSGVTSGSISYYDYNNSTRHSVTANTNYYCAVSTPSSSGSVSVTINYHTHSATSTYATNTYTNYGSASYCKLVKTCACGDPSTNVTTYPSHSFGSIVYPSTSCTQETFSTRTCSKCSYVEKTHYAYAAGHNYTGSFSDYTTYQHRRKCSRCSEYEYKNHTYGSYSKVDSNYHKATCSDCGRIQNSYHSYSLSGSNYVCSTCGDSYPASSGGSGGSGGGYSGGNYYYSIVPGNVRVTKLNKKIVSISIVKPYGAIQTEVFANGKKIKTLSRDGHFNYSGKGAVKARYQIRSLFNVGGENKYSGLSGVAKAASNVRVFSGAGSMNPRYVGRYMTCSFRPAKLSFSGNKLKVTGYIYNNRMFRLKNAKIRFYITINGKRYKKTVTKGGVSAYGKKKVSFVAGKGLSDVRNGGYYSYTYCDGNWGFGWNQ